MLLIKNISLKLVVLVMAQLSLFSAKSQVPTLNPFFFGNSEQTSDVTPFNLRSIGKHYADVKWNAGNIYLENGDSLIGYYMRYDLMRNHLETIIDTKIQAINGSYISHFAWFSTDRLRPEEFVNKKQTGLKNIKDIPGFVELLVDGSAKLYKCQIVFAPQQATSPSLLPDAAKKIHMLEKYYYQLNGEVFELENSNRRNLKNLESPQLSEYVTNQNLKFKVEADLIEIITEYNSINSK